VEGDETKGRELMEVEGKEKGKVKEGKRGKEDPLDLLFAEELPSYASAY